MDKETTNTIGSLKDQTLKDLQDTYRRHFPGKKISNNRTFLWRKVTYRMQALQFGELSAEAKTKLEALMSVYDPINNVALKPQVAASSFLPKRDRRLPLPGTIITKKYKGSKIQVKALENGFEYSGKIYKSLTAIAKEITGAHWNGFLFFKL